METKFIIEGETSPPVAVNPALFNLVARAYRWFDALATGKVKSIEELAAQEELSSRYVSRLLDAALLAPDIVEAIVEGRCHEQMTVGALSRVGEFPVDWQQQTGWFNTKQPTLGHNIHQPENRGLKSCNN